MALYNKHRPRNLGEVCGQDCVKTILASQIDRNDLSNAYLFTGPAGVGKTTVARILAAMINCSTGQTKDPPPDDPFVQSILSGRSQMDILDMDAASKRGIDDAKQIREVISCPPIEMRKRICIIDECHQLTPEAWAVLLKLLEEPPSYAVFILCTTEVNRVPDTIQSRCQCHDFRPLGADAIASYLRSLASKEGITIEEEGIKLIATSARGSLRDAVSKLEKARSLDGTAAAISGIVGVPSRKTVREFVGCVVTGDWPGALARSASCLGVGVPAAEFLRETAVFCADLLMCESKGFDFERNAGYSAEDAGKMPKIRDHLCSFVGKARYKGLVRAWIRSLDEEYKASVFNLNPQCQVNVAFSDMLDIFNKFKTPAAVPKAP